MTYLRPNPITPPDAALLRQKVDAIGMSRYAKYFEGAAQHGIALGPPPPGTKPFTRSGCAPTVPPGFVWPSRPAYDEGGLPKPYAFIAQIDLSETAAADVHGILPPKGLLYFFFESPEGLGGWDKATVLFYPEAQAKDTVEYDMTDPMIVAYTKAWTRGPHQYFDRDPFYYGAVGKATVAEPYLWALTRQGADVPDEIWDADYPSWDLDIDASRPDYMLLLGTDTEGPGDFEGKGPFEPWSPTQSSRLLFSPGDWVHCECPAFFFIDDAKLAAGDFSDVDVCTPQH
ncbi:DUF1963 domain-containing protein [Streptomyces sp. NPDC048462]|uniref:DUF1963 domain-containing protein n=1 Tax=Streptomyces sp. NPDC048462 TaxID=3365555 RepID=UPI003714C02E